MANRYKNLIYSNAEYTQTYGGFKGIELNAASLSTSRARLAYAENMYKDYDGDGADVIENPRLQMLRKVRKARERAILPTLPLGIG